MLARERIAARKKKRQEALEKTNEEEQNKSEAEKLLEEEEEDKIEDISHVDQIQREGTVAMQDMLLSEVEKKHEAEQEVSRELNVF